MKGFRVYPEPVPGSEGKREPNVQIVVQAPGRKKKLDPVYKQGPKHWPELNRKIDEVYEQLYERMKDKL